MHWRIRLLVDFLWQKSLMKLTNSFWKRSIFPQFLFYKTCFRLLHVSIHVRWDSHLRRQKVTQTFQSINQNKGNSIELNVQMASFMLFNEIYLMFSIDRKTFHIWLVFIFFWFFPSSFMLSVSSTGLLHFFYLRYADVQLSCIFFKFFHSRFKLKAIIEDFHFHRKMLTVFGSAKMEFEKRNT